MFAILGGFLFIIIAILTMLVAIGAPLGEFTMGGQFKVLPKPFRIMAVISFVIQVFAVVIILQAGGFINTWFSAKTTKYICIFFAGYLFINTVMNISSKSKKERYVMTPLSLIAAISFWITAYGM
ncbi:hypothetical protein [Clostridium sp.]|uniref:hypothetical protein n=1 Tax=Clostridium sp. TaxID=1506 RepID=UPI003F2F209D